MPWKKHLRAAHMLKQYHQRMLEYREWLGGKCTWCGSIERLEIDHIKRAWKQFRLAKGWVKHPMIVYAELMCCQLLCDECHKIKSQQD